MGGITATCARWNVCEAYQTPVSSHLFVEVWAVVARRPALAARAHDWWAELFDDRLRSWRATWCCPSGPASASASIAKALERFAREARAFLTTGSGCAARR